MENIHKLDIQKTKIETKRNGRILVTIKHLKHLIELSRESSYRTVSESIDSHDEIIDTIDALKMQSMKDDVNVSEMAAQIQELIEAIKIHASKVFSSHT
jgi:hypothetical protein